MKLHVEKVLMSALDHPRNWALRPNFTSKGEGEGSPSSCVRRAQDIHTRNFVFGRVLMMRWSLGASGRRINRDAAMVDDEKQ
jgi:hypothetical protein